jgi:hypothetical protein
VCIVYYDSYLTFGTLTVAHYIMFTYSYRYCHLCTRCSYSGDAGFGWPGVNGTPPLEIPAASCYLYFHSERGSSSATAQWGIEVLVQAKCTVTVQPPERPPLPGAMSLAWLKVFNKLLLLSTCIRVQTSALVHIHALAVVLIVAPLLKLSCHVCTTNDGSLIVYHHRLC